MDATAPAPGYPPHQLYTPDDAKPDVSTQFPDPDNGVHRIIAGLLMLAVALPTKAIIARLFELSNGARADAKPILPLLFLPCAPLWRSSTAAPAPCCCNSLSGLQCGSPLGMSAGVRQEHWKPGSD